MVFFVSQNKTTEARAQGSRGHQHPVFFCFIVLSTWISASWSQEGCPTSRNYISFPGRKKIDGPKAVCFGVWGLYSETEALSINLELHFSSSKLSGCPWLGGQGFHLQPPGKEVVSASPSSASTPVSFKALLEGHLPFAFSDHAM